MKQKLPAYAALLIAAATLWAACTKPSPFGSELLDEELAEYEFTDTLTIRCTILEEDSTLTTSDPSSTATAFLCGELDDPIFGKSRADIYALLQLGYLDPGFDTTKDQVDSIVLFLGYTPSGVYGDTLQPQDLRVYRVDAGSFLDDESDYYWYSSLPAATEIGHLNGFSPKPNKADSLFSTTAKSSFIRIPLSTDFGNELLHLDTFALQNDSAFYRALRGIKIVSSANASPGAMLAFSLNNTSFSRMRLYYHTTVDTGIVKKNFDFFFSGANKFSRFEHEYAGSEAGQKIYTVSEDFLYVQAMQGLRLKIEIPYVNTLDNIAVNKAQLVLTTASLPHDKPSLTPTKQLILTESRGDTTFVFTSDLLYSLGPALNQGFGRFGGVPEKENINGTLVERYRMTMTQRLQDMVDDTSGDIKKKTVYLNVSPQSRVAQRSVFYGPKNATFPAKLEIKYTRVQ